MNKLRKFINLTAGERRLLVSAVVYLVGIRLGHMVLPLRTLLRLTKRASERNHSGSNEGLPPERIAWAVQAVSRYLPGMGNCLTQAIAAQVMLARRNYPAHLHIGVAKDEGGRLKAHAWVECEGKIVFGGAGVSQYTPLPRLEI